jgi:hypothetical protein
VVMGNLSKGAGNTRVSTSVVDKNQKRLEKPARTKPLEGAGLD